MSRRGNGVRDSRNPLCFWPTTQMSVGIWLENFRRKLLQFECSKAVSNLGMSSFILLTKLCSATSFYTRTSHFFTLTFTNVED